MYTFVIRKESKAFFFLIIKNFKKIQKINKIVESIKKAF